MGSRAPLLEDLSDAVLLRIFSHLLERDLCRVARVCRRFRVLAGQPDLWRRLYRDLFEYDLPLEWRGPLDFEFVQVDPQSTANPWRASLVQFYRSLHASGVIISGARGSLDMNDIFRNAHTGVRVSAGSQPTLRGNRIFSNGEAGVELTENAAATLEYNHIFQNAFAGLSLASHADAVQTGNKMYKNRDTVEAAAAAGECLGRVCGREVLHAMHACAPCGALPAAVPAAAVGAEDGAGLAVCASCARKCHVGVGHKAEFVRRGRFACACGAGRLWQPCRLQGGVVPPPLQGAVGLPAPPASPPPQMLPQEMVPPPPEPLPGPSHAPQPELVPHYHYPHVPVVYQPYQGPVHVHYNQPVAPQPLQVPYQVPVQYNPVPLHNQPVPVAYYPVPIENQPVPLQYNPYQIPPIPMQYDEPPVLYQPVPIPMQEEPNPASPPQQFQDPPA